MKQTLRKDERQWLIYDEESVVSVVRSMEVIGLALAGPALANHRDIQLRAVGNIMMRLAETRLKALSGHFGDVPDENRISAEHVATILNYLRTGILTPDVHKAIEEFHGAVVWLDGRLRAAGTAGANWFQELARGG